MLFERRDKMTKERKLYRDPKNGMIFGVCAGLADYFDTDVAIMRVIWVFLVLFAGSGILAYLIIAIVLEPKDVVLAKSKKNKRADTRKERKAADDPFADYSDDPFEDK
jgi:phage shock protein C